MFYLLASENLEGLVHHEAAHLMTFQDCKIWKEFVELERKVRSEFVAVIYWYNYNSRDGAESIAEAFVMTVNSAGVPVEFEDLRNKYIKRWKK